MRVLLLVLLALCAVAHAQTVLDLTDATLADAINGNEKIMVEFFAPWCGHCKELAPHYDAAAKQLGAKGVLAKVDCTKNEESCRAHDADSYPTLKWFVNGVATPYTKARTQQAIVAFVLEQSRAAQVDLKDVAAADAFIAESLPHSTVAVIALATKSAGSTRTLFGAVAKELREEGFAFAATAVGDEESAQALAAHFNVQRTDAEVPMFILQKGFQDAQKQVVYSGELTEKAVAQWARLQSFPVFGEIGPDTHKRYQARGLPLLYFFIDPSDTETRAEVDAAVYAVAPRYLSQVSFVHCNAMVHQGQAETLGVTNTPGVVLHEHKHNHRYLLKGIITERSLTKFLDSWIDKTLPRHLKSQSPPKKQTKSVQVLVGKTFNQVALDDSKDVIVEFFAPWCSECKKFGPIYEKWAKANKDDSKLVVAAIDATSNDVDAPGVVFNSYPTIFLLLAGQKSQPIKFSGDRTEKGLTKWLKESREGRDKPKPPPLPEQQQVLQLTDKNWDDMLKQHPHLFVKFYAPWCGHCKALAPVWIDAAKQIDGRGRLGEVDCDSNSELCERFEATSYPTLKFFANGKPKEYDGGRSAADLTFYVVESAAPSAVRQLPDATDASIAAFVAKTHANYLTVVARLPKGAKAQVISPLNKAAEEMRWNGYVFASVVDEKVDEPTLTAYQAFDDKKSIAFSGEWKKAEIVEFLKSNSFPLVGIIGPDTEAMYSQRGLPLLHIWIEPSDASTASVLEVSRQAARQWVDKVSFVQADGERYGQHAETMGIATFPGLALKETDESGGRKYILVPKVGESLTVDSINEFLTAWENKKLKPFLRSQAVPKQDKKKSVVEIVGSNFEEVALRDTTKDVLVEFYAPWCSQCKKLTPIYEQLAKKYADDSNVLITKIDATENDVEGINIRSYPTIYFFPANNKAVKKAKKYDGARDLNSLFKYVEKRRSTKPEQKKKDEL